MYAAEFIIGLHDQSKTFEEFKAKIQSAGDNFSDSFIANLDRLITTLKPKKKKKKGKKKQQSEDLDGVAMEDDELEARENRERRARMFPGLAMPDVASASVSEQGRQRLGI